MKIGTTLEKRFLVHQEDTAQTLGSGNLHVLSTPIMIAWMENTAMTLIIDAIPKGNTSVGTAIQVEHIKPSAVGDAVICKATIKAVEGRKIDFEVICENENNEIIGRATHTRFIVDSEHFMSKLKKQ